MVDKSLANDFQYTKLKYEQYLYFSLNIPLMFHLFLFIQFIYQSLFLFCLFKLVFSINLIHFYLMYYPHNNTEHHKVIYAPSVEISRFFRKKTGKKLTILLFLANKRLLSLLTTGKHYPSLVIQIPSAGQYSSR